MWRTWFVVGVAWTGCCAMGIDWTDEAGKFLTKVSGIWRTGQFEDLMNELYVCDPLRLAPGEEVARDHEVIQQACSDMYAAGYTELHTFVQDVLPTGDNSAVVWNKNTFVNQNGSVMNGKEMFLLVNQWGQIRTKMLIFN